MTGLSKLQYKFIYIDMNTVYSDRKETATFMSTLDVQERISLAMSQPYQAQQKHIISFIHNFHAIDLSCYLAFHYTYSNMKWNILFTLSNTWKTWW